MTESCSYQAQCSPGLRDLINFYQRTTFLAQPSVQKSLAPNFFAAKSDVSRRKDTYAFGLIQTSRLASELSTNCVRRQAWRENRTRRGDDRATATAAELERNGPQSAGVARGDRVGFLCRSLARTARRILTRACRPCAATINFVKVHRAFVEPRLHSCDGLKHRAEQQRTNSYTTYTH